MYGLAVEVEERLPVQIKRRIDTSGKKNEEDD